MSPSPISILMLDTSSAPLQSHPYRPNLQDITSNTALRVVSPTFVGEGCKMQSINGGNTIPEPSDALVKNKLSLSTKSIPKKKTSFTKHNRGKRTVRFLPTSSFHDHATGSHEVQETSSSWMDRDSLISAHYRNRKNAMRFVRHTELIQAIDTCISDSDSAFDESSAPSQRIQQQLTAHHDSRGLEIRMLPSIRKRRAAIIRQVLLMASKMRQDGFLDLDMQAQWVAEKSQSLTSGSVRLARHLAEADASALRTSGR